jgi:hypothetical protein
MKTFIIVLLVVSTLLYSVRFFGWFVFFFRKDRDKVLKDLNQKKSVYMWSIVEHFIFMIALIGSIVLLI